MKTTKEAIKNVSPVNEENFLYSNKNIRILADKKAKLSGTAIKTGVAKENGIYKVLNALNGTGVITRIALSIALKADKKSISEKVPARSIVSALSLISDSIKIGKEGSEKNAIIGAENELGKVVLSELKTTGKLYKNFRTLRNRLIGDINSGLILGFAFGDSETLEAKNIFSKVK